MKAPAPAIRRPDFHEVAVAQIQDKYSSYPSNGLTPQRLANIFKEADAGDIMRQAELFEEMEEKDPHLFSQLQTRKNAVTGLDYEVIPFDSDDERDKEIAEFIESELNSIESFEDVMLDLLDAVGKGIAVSEIMWGFEAGRTTVNDIRCRHQKRFFWDDEDDFKVRTQDAPEGILLPENKFIVHRYKARSGHPARAGVLRVVAWCYLFKNYDLKDWVSFCEVFGMPLRLGKYAQDVYKRQAMGRMGANLHRPLERGPARGREGVLRGKPGRNARGGRGSMGGEALLLRPHGYPYIGGRGVLQFGDTERPDRPGELHI